MRNENYIHIQGWMINELKLSGNDLICYAIIYGFSQDGETTFNGSSSYLSNCMNCSKPTVFKSLNSLIKKKAIIKHEVFNNGVKFCQYSTFFTGSKESLRGVVKNLYGGSKESLWGGGKESLHNNTTINNTNNNTNSIEGKTKRFQPPTIQEIDDYILLKTGVSDLSESKAFYYHYDAVGWKKGKSSMKSWKSALSGWLNRKDKWSNERKQKQSEKTQDEKLKEIWDNMPSQLGK